MTNKTFRMFNVFEHIVMFGIIIGFPSTLFELFLIYDICSGLEINPRISLWYFHMVFATYCILVLLTIYFYQNTKKLIESGTICSNCGEQFPESNNTECLCQDCYNEETEEYDKEIRYAIKMKKQRVKLYGVKK